MRTRSRPMFSRLRAVMMLFMIIGMITPYVGAPAAAQDPPSPTPMVVCVVNEAGEPLPGVVMFGAFGTYTSGTNGCFETPYSEVGAYTVQSITAPAGYVSQENVQLQYDGSTPVTVTLVAVGGLFDLGVTVTDTNGDPVAGAVITLKNGDTATTDADGYAYLGDYASGAYTVEIGETDQAYGDEVQVVIEGADTNAPVTVQAKVVTPPELPDVVICVEDQNGAPLPGVELYGGFGTFYTGDDGCVTLTGFNDPGNYSVTATLAGYVTGNVLVVYDGTNPNIIVLSEVEVPAEEDDVVICVVDEADNPLAGVQLYGGFGTFTTGADGCVTLTGYNDLGNYSVTATLDGYETLNTLVVYNGTNPNILTLIETVVPPPALTLDAEVCLTLEGLGLVDDDGLFDDADEEDLREALAGYFNVELTDSRLDALVTSVLEDGCDDFVTPDPEGGARITVLKRFCETDESGNANSNCNGRLEADVEEVVFEVYEGTGTGGEQLDDIVMTSFPLANGSQGQVTTGGFIAGETYTVCEMPPPGWDPIPRPGNQGGSNQSGSGDCITVTLPDRANSNSVLQFNNFPAEEVEPGTAIVVKYFCTDEGITVPVVGDEESGYDGCEPATAEQLEGVNFWVYPFGVEADAINIDDSALLGEGVELPVGTHTLVEQFNGVIHKLADLPIVAGETTTIMVFNPIEEEPETGTAIVVKYFCTDEGITVPVVGDEESDYDGCEPATAEQLEGVNFWVYPFGVEADAINIDDSALLGDGVVLPVGTHTLVEEFNGVIHKMADLPIVAGETTTIMVFNPIEMERTVDIDIYKEVCEDVDESDLEDPCVPSDAMDGKTLYFTVFALTGDAEDDELEVIDYVEVSMEIEGNLGSAAVTGLPDADFYAVCEVVPAGIEGVYIYSIPGGEWVEVDDLGTCLVVAGEDIDDSNLIEVLFLNDVKKDTPVEPEKPTTPEKPVIPAPQQPATPQQPAAPVTKLPSTGSGTGDASTVEPWMLIASAAVLAGTGALLRKERPAA